MRPADVGDMDAWLDVLRGCVNVYVGLRKPPKKPLLERALTFSSTHASFMCRSWQLSGRVPGGFRSTVSCSATFTTGAPLSGASFTSPCGSRPTTRAARYGVALASFPLAFVQTRAAWLRSPGMLVPC